MTDYPRIYAYLNSGDCAKIETAHRWLQLLDLTEFRAWLDWLEVNHN